MAATAIINGTVYTPYQVIPQGLVLVEDGIIRAVGRSSEVALPPSARLIDAEGGRITPGLIDLVRFEETAESELAAAGVTSYCLALTLCEARDLPALRRAAAGLSHAAPGAHVLGLHLIGPWLAHCQTPPAWDDLWRAARAAITLFSLDPRVCPSPAVLAPALAAGARVVLALTAGNQAVAPFLQAGASAIRLHHAAADVDAPFVLATMNDDAELLAALWQQFGPDRFILCGSSARSLRGRDVRRLMARTGADFAAALACATAAPAHLLGLPQGRLEPGAPADLLCWTKYGDVAWTLVGGRDA